MIDTVGCKSFPEFIGPPGESPVTSYNRPYEGTQPLGAPGSHDRRRVCRLASDPAHA